MSSDDGLISPKHLRVAMPAIPKLPAVPDPSDLLAQIEHPSIRLAKANYASEFHRRLIDWINKFNAELDADHEVGVRLVSFGQAVTFHLDDVGFSNPSLITFSGKTEDGDPVELIQHVSQISVLLVRLRRKDPTSPKRRIGFHGDQAET